MTTTKPDRALLDALQNEPRKSLPSAIRTVLRKESMTRGEIAEVLETAFEDSDDKKLKPFVDGLIVGLRA